MKLFFWINKYFTFVYEKILNSEKIKEYDSVLNDKNLLNIYNETKHKLMKEENLSLMKDAFEEFIE